MLINLLPYIYKFPLTSSGSASSSFFRTHIVNPTLVPFFAAYFYVDFAFLFGSFSLYISARVVNIGFFFASTFFSRMYVQNEMAKCGKSQEEEELPKISFSNRF